MNSQKITDYILSYLCLGLGIVMGLYIVNDAWFKGFIEGREGSRFSSYLKNKIQRDGNVLKYAFTKNNAEEKKENPEDKTEKPVD